MTKIFLKCRFFKYIDDAFHSVPAPEERTREDGERHTEMRG